MMVNSHHTTVRHTLTGSFYVVLQLLGRRDYWDFMGYDGIYLELPVSIFSARAAFVPFPVILPEVFVHICSTKFHILPELGFLQCRLDHVAACISHTSPFDPLKLQHAFLLPKSAKIA